MTVLRLVLGDQLSRSVSSLSDIDKSSDVVLMGEVMEEASYVRHHKKKIAFIFSAMRHFAQALGEDGYTVRYVKLDDADPPESFTELVRQGIAATKAERLVVTAPGEYRVLEMMRDWESDFDIPVQIRADDRFLCSTDEFAAWAKGRKQLRMEYFYREMRRKTGLLMEGDKPAGGEWNFDKQNRDALPKEISTPDRLGFESDEITEDVLDLVEKRFSNHFGDLQPFRYGVTAEDAEAAFAHFLDECLPSFGTFQDAMKEGEPFLYHSLISAYLNAGLLDPLDLCKQAELRYRDGSAPINAVEGFIRQILGWREYVRGIYWLEMPGYAETNALDARRTLPDFYWTAETDMNCMKQVITETRQHAYAHHIQRLMITGNFALLAGIHPPEIEDWYLSVYADAYDWVELPNTHGMVMFADNGLLASKPYAASGAYIDRMSDYCGNCRYKVKEKLGEDACPFNALYWNFIAETKDQLKGNRRMAMIHASLGRMKPDQVQAMREKAKSFLDEVAPVKA